MKNIFECHVDKKEILKCIKNHESYDTWGDVEYGNNEKVVDYNICIDNSTETTEYCSAFAKLASLSAAEAVCVSMLVGQETASIMQLVRAAVQRFHPCCFVFIICILS